MSSIDYTTNFGAVAYFLGKDTDLKLKGKISLEKQGRIYQLKKNLSNVFEQKILIDLLNGIRFNAIEIIKKILNDIVISGKKLTLEQQQQLLDVVLGLGGLATRMAATKGGQ